MTIATRKCKSVFPSLIDYLVAGTRAAGYTITQKMEGNKYVVPNLFIQRTTFVEMRIDPIITALLFL